MATKAVNLKLDEADISAVKRVAAVFNMTMTDVVREAIREYTDRMRADPFYRLTLNVEDASPEETAETLTELDSLTDEDLTIAVKKRIAL